MGTEEEAPRGSSSSPGLPLCTSQTVRSPAQTSVSRTCTQDLAQVLLRWARHHQRNSLSAQSPSCPHSGALGSWFKVLSSGIPIGSSQPLGFWLQGSASEFKSQIQNMGSSRYKLSSRPCGLCLLVLAPSGRKGQHPWPPGKLSAQCPSKKAAKTK